MIESAFPHSDFYMVRHGHTEHAARGVMVGVYALLTKKGVMQGEALRVVHDAHFADAEKLYYVSSDSPRAIETCRLMTGDKPHVCIPGLTERASGRASGLMRQAYFDKVRYDPKFAAENGERLKKMGIQLDGEHAQIVVPALRAVLEQAPKGKTPIIVSHSGTMRAAAQAVGIQGFKPDNAQLYHFVPKETGEWKIMQVVLGDDGKTREVDWEVMRETSVPADMPGEGIHAPAARLHR